jgi:O-antigen ligase
MGALFWFALWCGYLAITALWAPEDARTEQRLIDLLMLAAFVLLAVLLAGRLARELLHLVWWWLFATGLVYFVVSLLNGPVMQGRYAVPGGGPNVFVRVMALAALATLFLASVRRQRWPLFALPVFLAGAFLSGSRGGLISFAFVAIAGAISTLRHRSHTRIGRYLVLAFAVVAAAAPWFATTEAVQVIRDRFIGQTFLDGYDSERISIFESAWSMFSDKPFTGVGLDGFHAINGTFEHAHNLPLAVAAESGLIGFLLFIIALGSFLKCAVRRKSSPETLFALLGAGYIFVASLFSGDYYDSRFMWLFLGIAAIEVRRHGDSTKQQEAANLSVVSAAAGEHDREPPPR